MLSMEEKIKVLKMLAEIPENGQENTPKIDVSNRLRDEKGRFLPDESQSRSEEEFPLRSIKMVKVKGTYGTYLIKERVFDEGALHATITIGTLIFLVLVL